MKLLNKINVLPSSRPNQNVDITKEWCHSVKYLRIAFKRKGWFVPKPRGFSILINYKYLGAENAGTPAELGSALSKYRYVMQVDTSMQVPVPLEPRFPVCKVTQDTHLKLQHAGIRAWAFLNVPTRNVA